MTRKKTDGALEQKISARQARILRLLVKRTLAVLNPDDAARDLALAMFDRALGKEMGPHGHPGP
jgi:hypothetical protein